jgi:2-iminobutanoate/2-iminopropanoate deaminase
MDFLSIKRDAARSRLASDVVRVGEWAFLSGQQPIDLVDDRVPLPEMVEAQTRKVLGNAEALLKTVEMRLEDVVSVRIFVVNFPKFYERMNDAYVAFFPVDRLPARTCIGVTHLTRGALVEMDFVACRPSDTTR